MRHSPHRSQRRAVAGTLAVLATVAVGALAGCGSLGNRFDGPDGDRRLYEARCGFCHVPYLPHDFAPREWPSLVSTMAARAGLSREQRTRVTGYLVREASAPVGGPATSVTQSSSVSDR